MIVFCFIVAFACLLLVIVPPSPFEWETTQAKRQRLTLAMGRALRHYAQTGKEDSLQVAQVIAYELQTLGVNLSQSTRMRLCGIV